MSNDPNTWRENNRLPIPERAYCDTCDTLIDLRVDQSAVLKDPWGNRTGDVLCENCRERRYDRQQEKLMEET